MLKKDSADAVNAETDVAVEELSAGCCATCSSMLGRYAASSLVY